MQVYKSHHVFNYVLRHCGGVQNREKVALKFC